MGPRCEEARTKTRTQSVTQIDTTRNIWAGVEVFSLEKDLVNSNHNNTKT